jgi:DNA-binding SARP family transcriptional activator
VNEFPVQIAKVQRPPLRAETLARHRLLDWLHVKIHSRVVLVLAEAGYGKTTLLADFSGRTRLRTLWYRLDEEDRDWVTLLHHLVAAGREHDPEFAPATAAMLADRGITGPARDAVIGAFIRELEDICEHGAVIIFDDFHLVDDAPDARLLARELVTRAPERLTVVFASRRPPTLPLAKLRAAGEVAELRTDDLRFDAEETARLFTETYNRALDADVLADLSARTEGWAASLQLVQAALRDRSPAEIRRFVRELTGADHELYDYLAEEVVGDLPQELQEFLMRTAILQAVTPELAAVVTDRSPDDTRRLMALAERLSLLSRRGRTNRELRYHPLVRDFLEARLVSDVGADAVSGYHLRVGSDPQFGWRLAGHHLLRASCHEEVLQLLDGSLAEIMGTGAYTVAASYLSSVGRASVRRAFADVIDSRLAIQEGDQEQALVLARRAADHAERSDLALANLASLLLSLVDVEQAAVHFAQLKDRTHDPDLTAMASAALIGIEVSGSGNLPEAISAFETLARQQESRGHLHYAAVSYYNAAHLLRCAGRAEAVLRLADRVRDLFEQVGAGGQLSSAMLLLAWGKAHAGMWQQALADVKGADPRGVSAQLDMLLEATDMHLWYGSEVVAQSLLARADHLRTVSELHREWLHARRVEALLRSGRVDEACEAVSRVHLRPDGEPASVARKLFLKARVEAASGGARAKRAAMRARAHAESQGATFWARTAELLVVIIGGGADLDECLEIWPETDMVYASILAEEVVEALPALSEGAVARIRREASIRPQRWVGPLRRHIDTNRSSVSSVVTRLLEEIGELEDVARLRKVARSGRTAADRQLGRSLARRLAPRVMVEDQGRVRIRVGDRTVAGTEIRRKVLALTCYLITRPSFAATRDQVLDALWPDVDPEVAINSLNQTVYFLRRVFEPEFKEDLSPGYVHHSGDLLWLDEELVESRSRLSHGLVLQATQAPDDLEHVHELLATYRGEFALDFMYEEWAAQYREPLHAAFLQVVEAGIQACIADARFADGIAIARSALEVAPAAEPIELNLMRLYRLVGAHAAAAEHYSHYAAAYRADLGVEPPPLENI